MFSALVSIEPRGFCFVLLDTAQGGGWFSMCFASRVALSCPEWCWLRAAEPSSAESTGHHLAKAPEVTQERQGPFPQRTQDPKGLLEWSPIISLAEDAKVSLPGPNALHNLLPCRVGWPWDLLLTCTIWQRQWDLLIAACISCWLG